MCALHLGTAPSEGAALALSVHGGKGKLRPPPDACPTIGLRKDHPEFVAEQLLELRRRLGVGADVGANVGSGGGTAAAASGASSAAASAAEPEYPHAYVMLRADFDLACISITLCGAAVHVPVGSTADDQTPQEPGTGRRGPQPLVRLCLRGVKGNLRYRPRAGAIGVGATVHLLEMFDMATPCRELHSCVAHGTLPDRPKPANLITVAFESAPLGSEAAAVINIEIGYLKLLFTAQLLAYFLLFFIKPPDYAAVGAEVQEAIDGLVRGINQKMANGIRAAVVDGLGMRPLLLHLHLDRLEILWVEHKLPTPGFALTPRPSRRRTARAAWKGAVPGPGPRATRSLEMLPTRVPAAPIANAGQRSPPLSVERARSGESRAPGGDRVPGGESQTPISAPSAASTTSSAPISAPDLDGNDETLYDDHALGMNGFHTLCIRCNDVTFDWDPPGKPPPGATLGSPPEEQTWTNKSPAAQLCFLPPDSLPSAWLRKDDLVDRVVAASGWQCNPLALQIKFIFALEMQRRLFRPAFRLDFSADGPVHFNFRVGHALTVVALVQSLLRALAPLLHMMDSNVHWPMVGDGASGFLNVTEAVAQHAAKAAAAVAAAGHLAPSSRSAGKVLGGCFVSIGSGVLQYYTMEGVRRSLFLDTFELLTPTVTALTLYTPSYAPSRRVDGEPTRGDGQPRAVTLHASSITETHLWTRLIRAHQRSNNLFGAAPRRGAVPNLGAAPSLGAPTRAMAIAAAAMPEMERRDSWRARTISSTVSIRPSISTSSRTLLPLLPVLAPSGAGAPVARP